MLVAVLKVLVFQIKLLSNGGVISKINFIFCSIKWVSRPESTSQLYQLNFYSVKTNHPTTKDQTFILTTSYVICYQTVLSSLFFFSQ